MVLRFEDVDLFLEPSPHYIINEVFEGDFYAELVDSIPSFADFDSSNPQSTGTMALTNFCALSDRHMGLGRKLQKSLMRLNTRISSINRELLKELGKRDAYLPFLDLINDFDWEEPAYFRFRERGNGFSLPPHMDGPYFASTHILYLASSTEDSANGTMLFSPDPSSEYDPLRGYLSMWPKQSRWIVTKKVDYVPNRLFGFLNTPWSIHGHTPFRLHKRRLTINISMKHSDSNVKTLFGRLDPTYRRYFAKPKILDAILQGVDTSSEMKQDPEGRFAFLYG